MALGPARQLYDEQQSIRSSQRQLAAGDSEFSRLIARIQSMQDPNHVEQRAREELGYVRPGETSYLILRPRPQIAAPPAPKTAPLPATANAAPRPGSLLHRVWARVQRLW
jgi:hypothetical protein